MLRWVHLKMPVAFVDNSCEIVGEDSIAYNCLHTCILFFFPHATAPPFCERSPDLICVRAELVISLRYLHFRQTFDRPSQFFGSEPGPQSERRTCSENASIKCPCVLSFAFRSYAKLSFLPRSYYCRAWALLQAS
jgi:hypothetical protein